MQIRKAWPILLLLATAAIGAGPVRAETADAGTVAALAARGEAELDGGNVDAGWAMLVEAHEKAGTLPESDPDRALPSLAMARAYLGWGDLEGALDHAASALATYDRLLPQDSPARLAATALYADALARAGRLEEEIPLREVILSIERKRDFEADRLRNGERDPKDHIAMADALFYHGMARGRLYGRTAIGPDFRLAALYYQRGRLPGETPRPNHVMSLYHEAINAHDRRESWWAEHYMRSAIELDEAAGVLNARQRIDAKLVMMDALIRLERIEEARPFAEEVLTWKRANLPPEEQPDALRQYAVFLLFSENFAEGIATMREAIRLMESLPEPDASRLGLYHEELSNALVESGEPDAALAALDRAIELYRPILPDSDEKLKELLRRHAAMTADGTDVAEFAAPLAVDDDLPALASDPAALRKDLLTRYLTGDWQSARRRADTLVDLADRGESPPFDDDEVALKVFYEAAHLLARLGSSGTAWDIAVIYTAGKKVKDKADGSFALFEQLGLALIETDIGGRPDAAEEHFNNYFALASASGTVPAQQLTVARMIAAHIADQLGLTETVRHRIAQILPALADLDPADPMTLLADQHFHDVALHNLRGEERRRVVALIEARARTRPEAIVHHAALASNRAHARGKDEDAGEPLRLIADLQRHLTAMETALPRNHTIKINLLRNIGSLAIEAGRDEIAEPIYRRAAAMVLAMQMVTPFEQAAVLNDLVNFLSSRNRHSEALVISQRSYDMVGDDPDRPAERAMTASWHANALFHAGRSEAALAPIREARERFGLTQSPGSPDRLAVGLVEADLLYRLDRMDEARAVLSGLSAEIEASGLSQFVLQSAIDARLGQIGTAQGDFASANRHLAASLGSLAKLSQGEGANRALLGRMRPIVELRVGAAWRLSARSGQQETHNSVRPDGFVSPEGASVQSAN